MPPRTRLSREGKNYRLLSTFSLGTFPDLDACAAAAARRLTKGRDRITDTDDETYVAVYEVST